MERSLVTASTAEIPEQDVDQDIKSFLHLEAPRYRTYTGFLVQLRIFIAIMLWVPLIMVSIVTSRSGWTVAVYFLMYIVFEVYGFVTTSRRLSRARELL